MRSFVANHPIVTQFFVLLGVIFLSIPAWIVAWIALATVGRMVFDEGCQARGYDCTNSSLIFIAVVLILAALSFAGFVFSVSRVSGWATHRLLRWAGLNPKVALS